MELISLGFYKVLKGLRELLQVVANLSYLGIARVFHFCLYLHNLPVVLGVTIYTTHWCSATTEHNMLISLGLKWKTHENTDTYTTHHIHA